MKWRKSLVLLASAACCALTTGAISAGSAASAASAASSGPAATAVRLAASADLAGHLGAAQPVPGLAALNAGGQAQVGRVACPSPGACTAAGSYVNAAGHNQAFVADERNFSWQKAIPIPGLSALNSGGPSDVTSLSCADATHCAVGGWYVNTHGNLIPFVADKTDGRWGNAHDIVFLDPSAHQFFALVTSLSCPAPGDCTAAVTIPATLPSGLARFGVFVSEVNGTWGLPQGPPGFTGNAGGGLPEEITSVSCWSAGNCLAGGAYTTVPTGNSHPFIVTESNGTWGHVEEPPGIAGNAVTDYNPRGDAQVLSVSCTTAGSCAVSGVYTDSHGGQQVFEADEINGAWKTQTLPGSAELNTGGSAVVNEVSCGVPFDCAVAGQFTDSAMQSQALVAGESGGLWRNAQQILGINDNPGAAAFAVSCSGARHCLAGGSFTDTAGHQQAYVAYENADPGTTDVGTFGGAFGVARGLNTGGNAAVNNVSCSLLSECAIGGFYTDAAGHTQGFVAEQSAQTTSALSLSAARVKAGHEEAEHLTVHVKPRTGGTPAGKVTIKAGKVTLCVITLKKAKGTCTLTASKLRPGTYKLVAAYPAGAPYAGSASPGKTLTVTS